MGKLFSHAIPVHFVIFRPGAIAAVCATIKHFMANTQEYDRHNVDSLIDERTMREIYLPVFETAVKEGPVRHHGLLQLNQWRTHVPERLPQ